MSFDAPVGPTPSSKEVLAFHLKADTDGDEGSTHHTLGSNKGQASPGDHTHDGGSSKLLLEGVTITGNTATAVINSIVDALVVLGATDSTVLAAQHGNNP